MPIPGHETEATDYDGTLARLEPNILAGDVTLAQWSIAISLRRIADALERMAAHDAVRSPRFLGGANG